MEKINLYDFYNHNKAKKDAKEGNEIINNTDFKKCERDRIEEAKNYKIGDIIIFPDRVYNGKIVKIEEGYLYIQPLNKTTNKNISKYGIITENAVVLKRFYK